MPIVGMEDATTGSLGGVKRAGGAVADTPAIDQLLLPATGSAPLPPWLNPALFLATDFDPEACIVSLRRQVPLATLQSELQVYLQHVKAKLVEVINEDYGDYIGLSSKLSAVDGAVMRMRKPLVELKEKLNVVQVTEATCAIRARVCVCIAPLRPGPLPGWFLNTHLFSVGLLLARAMRPPPPRQRRSVAP